MSTWTYADGPHLIPVDTAAEWVVAGLAIADRNDTKAVGTLAPWFHDRRLADIVTAAHGLDPEVSDGEAEWATADAAGDFGLVVHGCAARVNAIAAVTGDPVAFLRQLVEARPVAHFEKWLGRRLMEAHAARSEIASLIGQLDGLGVDVALLTEADVRRRELLDHVIRLAAVSGALIAGRAEPVDLVDALIDLGALVGLSPIDIGDAVLGDVVQPSEDP